MAEPFHVPWGKDDPIIRVTITEPDLMTVFAMGIPYPVPADWQPLRRDDFNKVMAHIHNKYPIPLSVEIIETDGTRHTGIVDIAPTDTTPPPPLVQPEPVEPARRAPEGVIEPVYPARRGEQSPHWHPGMEEATWVRPIDEPEAAPMPETVASIGSNLAGLPSLRPSGLAAEDVETFHERGFQPGEPVVVGVLLAHTVADPLGRVDFGMPRWLLQSLSSGELALVGLWSNRPLLTQAQPRR